MRQRAATGRQSRERRTAAGLLLHHPRTKASRPCTDSIVWVLCLLLAAVATVWSLVLGFYSPVTTTATTETQTIRQLGSSRGKKRSIEQAKNMPPNSVRHARGKDEEFTTTYARGASATSETPSFDYNIPAFPNGDTLPDPSVLLLSKTADESSSSSSTSLIVLVLSARENAARRKAIRETWGRNHTLLFAVGGGAHISTDDEAQLEQQRQLHQEQRGHHDLLDTIHPDSYASLPHKLKFAYHWIVRNSNKTNVQWILKVDDDMFARVQALQENLLPLFNHSVPTVIGNIIRNAPVQRHGKWAETTSFRRESPIYPPFPQGSCGYVVSRAAADYIANEYESDLLKSQQQQTATLLLSQGEDTSLGIWLEQSRLNVYWVQSPYFVNHGDCMLPRNGVLAFSIGHKITPHQMRRCFESSREVAKDTLTFDERLYYLETSSQRMTISANAPSEPKTSEYWSAIAHQELDRTNDNRKMKAAQQKKRREEKRMELRQQQQKNAAGTID